MRKYILLVVFSLICFSCLTKSKETVENKIDYIVSEVELDSLFYSGSIHGIYKSYADSIKLSKEREVELPYFISTYYSKIEGMEKTGFHITKRTVYNSILNQCDYSELKYLIDELSQSENRNGNEDLVLEVAKYLIFYKNKN